ncbi:MAG TPA: hypothetical protein VGN44_05675 [Candidatus Angelobacter sp.]
MAAMPGAATQIPLKSLPPFGSTKECPKCGGTQLFRRFHAGGTFGDQVVPEYMRLSCGGCGYADIWEAVKDAAAAE